MLNAVYRLVAPRRFELFVVEEEVADFNVVVRPTYLSICNADQRYYQGTRDSAVLSKKLPMALIHEAIGEVVVDRTGMYSPGTCVVMIPNLPRETDLLVAENYLRSSKFRASSADGFMQELIVTTPDRIVPAPSFLDEEVAAFTELASVMTHVISRFDRIANLDRETIGFWGDGNLGFIGSLFCKSMFPNSRVIVVGKNPDKLNDFTFVDETYLVEDLPADMVVSHAFECAGGMGSARAIDQIINHIKPEGTIALCGVTEDPVPVNTRMVLEKGLRLFGSSRSGRDDFVRTLKLYEENRSIPEYLKRIVGPLYEVRDVSGMNDAFEGDIRKSMGKTVMRWMK